jgi:putative FmdB family regulatory protein
MIYQYSCSKCGNEQEINHGMKENPEIKCDNCQTVMNIIITGGTGVIFKGGGWTTSDSKFKQSQIKKQEKISQRMKENWEPVSKVNQIKN